MAIMVTEMALLLTYHVGVSQRKNVYDPSYGP